MCRMESLKRIKKTFEVECLRHNKLTGREIQKVAGEGDNAKATIRFKNAGDKQLLLRFARFKVLS